MAWEAEFRKGINEYKATRYQQSLTHLTKAHLGGTRYNIFDSRAAVHEKLKNTKNALLDAKRVIELAPQRWQGYYRSARLFFAVGKYEHALKMIDCALARIDVTDTKRRQELELLGQNAANALENARRHTSRITCHLAKLPFELLVEIFSVLLEENPQRILVFASVCMHWRDVALNAPVLWGALVLTARNPSKKIQLWKERSRGRIFSVVVRDDAFPETPKPCYDRLDGQNLRSLEFCDVSICPPPWTTRAITITALRTLTIRGLTLLRTPDLIQVLHRNPYMETLVVDLSSGSTVDAYFHEEDGLLVELPNLAHLELANVHLGAIDIIRWLRLSKLQVLRLDAIRDIVDNFLSFLTTVHGTNSLTTLRLARCIWTAEALKALVAACPDMETLEVTAFAGEDINNVVESLAPAGTSEVRLSRWPLLKNLDFSGNPRLRTGPLIKLVKARLPLTSQNGSSTENSTSRTCDITPIQSLNVNGCDRIEAESLPWFRSVVKAFSCVYMTRKQAKRVR
ncbi:hypothetical protein PUNSTDRAFT_59999 [Punctularia strigosozonata HHB-11173 SS5]|uniref:uncharacterized protein n=1 Tax=Punctularia strigosozonata (strain HHB-11173) TaxID=741275 RepID=UPI0004416817|nr:uncharacterized protein PUNSTDRAFT_59999 [Punctularia strigosozonata HHB-11173 SS5]EIN12876.1 hypothetical protein PUNSTDRAFT_59999 [Punctularia strigosozonata HHB-11173 SS5]